MVMGTVAEGGDQSWGRNIFELPVLGPQTLASARATRPTIALNFVRHSVLLRVQSLLTPQLEKLSTLRGHC